MEGGGGLWGSQQCIPRNTEGVVGSESTTNCLCREKDLGAPAEPYTYIKKQLPGT